MMRAAARHGVDTRAVRDYRVTLRKLAIRDDELFDDVLSSDAASMRESSLDAKTYALVQLAALVAVGGSPPAYRPVIDRALARGASVDEVVGTLIAVTSASGAPRVVSAAPAVGLAIGYDVRQALEEWESSR
jgi:4-carboxymuconolactone decarboxylase